MESLVTARVSASALRHNLAVLRRRLRPGAGLRPTVKANAYGHGIATVLPILAAERPEQLVVANLNESLELRDLGWSGPILCLAPMLAIDHGGLRAERAAAAVAADVTLTVMTPCEADALAQAARRAGRPGRVELKLDTGMGRMGTSAAELRKLLEHVNGSDALVIEGLYTHFARADEPDLEPTQQQLATFATFCQQLNRSGFPRCRYHSANSAALFRSDETHLDGARPGLSVYGYWPGPAETRPAELKPCLRVETRFTSVRRFPPGHGIGYGATFVTTRPSVIGLLPLGYADGYPRGLSNRGTMTLEPIRGQPRRHVPVVGRISMDQVTVDLTDAGDVRIGDPVTVIDDDPAAPNSVESLARTLDTIPYELTCGLGLRIRRQQAP